MIKVFNYPWHIAHQYSLMQLPDTQWDWLVQHRRQYSSFPRGPFFEEMGGTWVPHYEEGKYDVALLHLDQQCFEDTIWERGKGSLYREVNSVVKDIPKIVIMHGTPFYPEMFTSDVTEDNYKELGLTKHSIGMSSELIKKFKEAVEDIDVVVFNSRQAQKQWGFYVEGSDVTKPQFVRTTKAGKKQYALTIWHGLDSDEWWNLPKEPRVVTMISPAGLDRYYDRTLLRGVKELLAEKGIEHCHITVDASFKSWDEYRNFLGRSLVYFNPTHESPMPRSRTEAMLSGCAIVTRPGQDVEEFIEDGKNGVIVPRNPQFIAEVIEALILDYKKAVELGNNARKTAKEVFSVEEYHRNWQNVFNLLKHE